MSFARFGEYFAEGLTSKIADIDKDEQVSVLESFLFASKKVEEFYQSESRLATEHALIDDNGDGKGTPLEFFRGVRVNKTSSDDAIPDGISGNQIHLIQSEFEKQLSQATREKRNLLELEIAKLRLQKPKLAEEEYFAKLEAITMKLALLYQTQQKDNVQLDAADAKKIADEPLAPQESEPSAAGK